MGARGTNRLVVIKKHDPPMYYLLKSGTSGVQNILGPVVGTFKIGLTESGSEESVGSNLRVSAGLRNSIAGDVDEDSANPGPNTGGAGVRGFPDPDGGKGGKTPAVVGLSLKVGENEIELINKSLLPGNMSLDPPESGKGIRDKTTSTGKIIEGQTLGRAGGDISAMG